MNRLMFVVFLFVSFLYGAVEDVEARTVSIMDSLNHAAGDTITAQKMIVSIKMDSFNLAVGDTISAQTMIDSIKTAGKEDTLFFNGLVIDGDFNFKESGIETVWCILSFDTVKFQGDTNFDGVQFKRNVYFKGAQFQSNAYFIRTQFQGNANLSDATFKGV